MKDEQLSFQRAERGKNEKKKMFIYKDPSTDPQDTHAPAKLKKKKVKLSSKHIHTIMVDDLRLFCTHSRQAPAYVHECFLMTNLISESNPTDLVNVLS